jgi:hypothetical protein
MPALVVASQEEQGVRVPYFEGPEVEDALSSVMVVVKRGGVGIGVGVVVLS